MNSSNFCASIAMCKRNQILTYSRTPMLMLSITYPKVALCHNPSAQNSLNCQIQAQVEAFYRYASSSLYQQAVVTYKSAQENEFPFHRYDAVLKYEITHNQYCHLSLYRDQYEYAGGAHGSTVRSSDTWNLANACSIPMSGLFPAGQDFRTLLTGQILKQANERIQRDPGIFFEDYPELIVKYFNEEHYYLTPSGVAIYYQQYEIAPYATGIVVFTIPYQTLHWHPSQNPAEPET